MEMLKNYSRHSLLFIVFIMALLLFLVDGAFYWGIEQIFSHLTISGKTGGGGAAVVDLLGRVTRLQHFLKVYFVPISAVSFGLAAFVLWIYLRTHLAGLLKKQALTDEENQKKSSRKLQIDPRKERTRNERHFLHLLTIFQREGRLVDFFSEDLNLYEDAQIGAAVRSIHESCKKNMAKYFRPQAVIDHNEGDEVTVEPGFDPDAIKLTGNVTGEPPFKGILRHRGWKTTNIELPTLSDVGDSKIIAPAEVEIKG